MDFKQLLNRLEQVEGSSLSTAQHKMPNEMSNMLNKLNLISEGKMADIKGKKHSGKYGTEYQGDEDEDDDDEDKKKSKADKSKSKDDDSGEKKGRGRPRKDQDVKQSGDKKFGGADDAFALIAGGKGKGKGKDIKGLKSKKHSLKEYVEEIETRILSEQADNSIEAHTRRLQQSLSEMTNQPLQVKQSAATFNITDPNTGASIMTSDPAVMNAAKQGKMSIGRQIKETDAIAEKAVSKAQQKFMGMVHAAQKGKKPASAEVAKVAKGMSKKDAKDFAATKHKGLPEKVKKTKVNEGMMHLLEVNDSSLEHIVKRFKHEVKSFLNGNDLDNDLFDALYDYYLTAGEMPYGIAKARDGDPYQWVSNRFYDDVVNDSETSIPDDSYIHDNDYFDDHDVNENQDAGKFYNPQPAMSTMEDEHSDPNLSDVLDNQLNKLNSKVDKPNPFDITESSSNDQNEIIAFNKRLMTK